MGSRITIFVALISFIAAAVAAAQTEGRQASMRAYVGTYTGKDSKGIYLFNFDNGQLSPVGLAGEVGNPSFLAFSPDSRFLFSVSEGGDFKGQKTGGVSSFSINPETGMLTLINQQSSEGLWPCHISVPNAGRPVMLANYGSGVVASYAVGEDGALSPATSVHQHEGTGANPKRQEKPHAHSITPDPNGRFALACDLGADKIYIYRIEGDKLVQHRVANIAAGSGPRHLTFNKAGKIVYLINELNGTMTVFRYNAEEGALDEIQTISTLPTTYKGENLCADVHVHPSGRFVYGTNRGHDSIVIFAADEQGKLTLLGHEPTRGKHPRNFALDPEGQHLLVANQHTNNVEVFSIDQGSGRLTHKQSVSVAAPVCVKFLERR